MSTALRNHPKLSRAVGIFEHTALAVLGLILMILGAGLGVTIIALPVGLALGLIGVALVVGALFEHIDPGR